MKPILSCICGLRQGAERDAAVRSPTHNKEYVFLCFPGGRYSEAAHCTTELHMLEYMKGLLSSSWGVLLRGEHVEFSVVMWYSPVLSH